MCLLILRIKMIVPDLEQVVASRLEIDTIRDLVHTKQPIKIKLVRDIIETQRAHTTVLA